MKHRCGTELVWTLWNTEKGVAKGWYCPKCDIYDAEPVNESSSLDEGESK